jgi:Ca2+-binding RTX toxin-like protein
MNKVQGPEREDDLPLRTIDGERVYASADPFAGVDADNGKPIEDLEWIAANLNRTGYDWNTNFTGQLNDGVLNFGFFNTQSDFFGTGYINDTFTSAFAEFFDFQAFNAEQRVAARSALGLWDDLISITFRETSVAAADIRFGNTDTGGAQAYAYLPFGDRFNTLIPGFTNIDDLAGDVWVDKAVPSNFFPIEDSFYSVTTLIHELGHALGLSHPGDYDALDDSDGDGVPDPISYENSAEFYQDSLQYSIMSYWDAYETGAMHIDWELARFGYAATPLVHDVAAIQAIYGADLTTRTGDTVYGFNSTADRSAYDFSSNTVPIVTIYDAGGNDTLDLSGYSTDSLIDLNEGAFSSAGGIEQFRTFEEVNAARVAKGLPARTPEQWEFYEGLKEELGLTNGLLKDNISIAYGTLIENAKGGAGDDTLIGNQVANVLTGGDGVDRLTGNGGNDIFVAELNATKIATKEGGLSLDIILDFTRRADKIDLSGIDANTTRTGEQEFNFRGKANGKTGDLFYKSYGSLNAAEKALGVEIGDESTISGPVSIVFGNNDADKDADFALVLIGVKDVAATDFIFG